MLSKDDRSLNMNRPIHVSNFILVPCHYVYIKVLCKHYTTFISNGDAFDADSFETVDIKRNDNIITII